MPEFNFLSTGNRFKKNQRPLSARTLLPINTTNDDLAAIPYTNFNTTDDGTNYSELHLYSSIDQSESVKVMTTSSSAPQRGGEFEMESQYSLLGPEDGQPVYHEPTTEGSHSSQVNINNQGKALIYMHYFLLQRVPGPLLSNKVTECKSKVTSSQGPIESTCVSNYVSPLLSIWCTENEGNTH